MFWGRQGQAEGRWEENKCKPENVFRTRKEGEKKTGCLVSKNKTHQEYRGSKDQRKGGGRLRGMRGSIKRPEKREYSRKGTPGSHRGPLREGKKKKKRGQLGCGKETISKGKEMECCKLRQ